MGKIQFWLSQGSSRLQLPVNPESVSVTSPFDYEDVKVAQLGEITIIGERGQRELSISSFFPYEYNSVYCGYSKIPKPANAVALIEKWRDSRKSIRFNVTGTSISFNVTVREFTVEPERAGSPGDIYYTISLKEYREVAIKTVKTSSTAKASSNKRPSPSKSKPKTYTVRSGDSLWKISRRYYGAGSKWRTIYNANTKVIGKNPNLIRPGQKLVIPNG